MWYIFVWGAMDWRRSVTQHPPTHIIRTTAFNSRPQLVGSVFKRFGISIRLSTSSVQDCSTDKSIRHGGYTVAQWSNERLRRIRSLYHWTDRMNRLAVVYIIYTRVYIVESRNYYNQAKWFQSGTALKFETVGHWFSTCLLGMKPTFPSVWVQRRAERNPKLIFPT